MRVFAPDYYWDFKCIASACPDSCCHGWTVDIDEKSARYYQALPGALGDRVRSFLKQEAWGWSLSLEENGRCPMWRQDGLCRIQAELGEDALSSVCKTFPRLVHDYGSFQELGLELSCPEAARMILGCDSFSLTAQECPGGDVPEYDEDAMGTLLRTRTELIHFIGGKSHSIQDTLAVTLLYGYQVQQELDGAEPACLDAEKCLRAAWGCAGQTDPSSLPRFFQGLEILSQDWAMRLQAGAISQTVPEAVRPLLIYFLSRYYLQAVSDCDIICRIKLAIASCLMIACLGGDLLQTAQQFSKEIENDPDNVEALLEGAYTAPELTDRNLLGLLLK